MFEFEESPVEVLQKRLCEALHRQTAMIVIERVGNYLSAPVTAEQIRHLADAGVLQFLRTESSGTETIFINGEKVITFESPEFEFEGGNLKASRRYS